MSPSSSNPNEILSDDNYFLWEFNARMALARKELLDHIFVKPEDAARRETDQWKVADVKALAVISKMLSPTYQSMVRESTSALEAWETLRAFFVKQSLHNRVQLRKELHEFTMADGGNIMDHMVRFDDLCAKLSAVGETMSEEERLVILLGSLPVEYDAMVRILEAMDNLTLLAAKEKLRQEYETIKKREKKEEAFRATARDRGGRGVHGRGAGRHSGGRGSGRGGGAAKKAFSGKCYECKQFGHKKDECPRLKGKDHGEFVFSATSTAAVPDSTWLLDSGASSHMSGDKNDFVEYRDLVTTIDITVANGQRMVAVGVGSARLRVDDSKTIKLTNVLYVPHLDRKLLSISALTARGVTVQFENKCALLVVDGHEVVSIPKVGKLFVWSVGRSRGEAASQATSEEALEVSKDEGAVWHARLGHVSAAKVASIVKAVDGVPPVERQDGLCEGCARGKMLTSPFAHGSGSDVKTTTPFQLVHSDVVGPIKPKSKGGAQYVVTFIDDFSRYVHVYLLSSKAQVFDRFKEYVALVANQYAQRVKRIRSDNGGEYLSKRFNAFCAAQGIVHQTSAPYSPQQNGLAERMNRTAMEMARSMLHHMQVDRQWWGEAVMTAVHVINRIPNTARPDQSPLEVLTGAATSERGVIFLEDDTVTGGGPVAQPSQDTEAMDVDASGAQDDAMDMEVDQDDHPVPLNSILALPRVRNPAPFDRDEPESKRPRLDEYEIALAADEVPTSYSEAMASPDAKQWKEAIRSEIRSHVQNHTWDMVRRPHGVKVIGSKWVFARKYDEHGNVVRHKARLVAQGFLQTQGRDYFDTYSPVASMNTIRAFLAVCCSRRLLVRQFDIETAFLNGELEEDVFMQPPEGVNVASNMVCKLRRSLYGLKQAAAVWYKTLRDVFRGEHGGTVYVVLYVDDLLVGCASEEQAEAVRDGLARQFTVKSLGDARLVLGMELDYDRDRGELKLKQAQFITRMLERFGQATANAVRNPLIMGQDLSPDDTHTTLATNTKYRELIGSLLYVANATRPDISSALSVLSQYLDCPREIHWRAAIRVLQYLKGTATLGVKYSSKSDTKIDIVTYSDANWGSDKATRRSTSGVLVMLAGGPVVYKSKRQQTVALSSAEAEYMALALATQEVVWLRFLLAEMGLEQHAPTSIYMDNKAAISIATNHGYTARAKHIDLRAHFVRDHVENDNIKLEYVPSAGQVADYLTKAVPTPRLMELRRLSGIVD
ncbi:hypothetical protein ATCC90586_004055 [Pythium insidiosum]|nr:hypothetical protein ATCC90586_004055 [Pythium insidiosum]